MRRVVKLNERDLSRIVRRVMNEGLEPVDTTGEMTLAQVLQKYGDSAFKFTGQFGGGAMTINMGTDTITIRQ